MGTSSDIGSVLQAERDSTGAALLRVANTNDFRESGLPMSETETSAAASARKPHQASVFKGGQQELAADFGPWLTRMREAQNLNMTQLAERMGILPATLRKAERSEYRVPSVEFFQRLSRGLGLDLGYILYKAGFDIGRDGLDMARLVRVEAIIERLDKAEPVLRSALAEASTALSESVLSLDPAVNEAVQGRINKALTELDLIAERLREGRKS